MFQLRRRIVFIHRASNHEKNLNLPRTNTLNVHWRLLFKSSLALGTGFTSVTSFCVQYKVWTPALSWRWFIYPSLSLSSGPFWDSSLSMLQFGLHGPAPWGFWSTGWGQSTAYWEILGLWIPPDPNIQPCGERSSKAESSQLEIRERVEKAEGKQ